MQPVWRRWSGVSDTRQVLEVARSIRSPLAPAISMAGRDENVVLFSKETIALNSAVAAVVIGSSSSDLKRVGKIQPVLLEALTPAEQLIAVSADAQNWGSGVMAVTSRRILYGTGSHIDYSHRGRPGGADGP